jgi:hypothetical protein
MNDPKLGFRSVKGEFDFASNRALVCAAFRVRVVLPGAESRGSGFDQHVATLPRIVGIVNYIWHRAIDL